jgi:glutathione S-transferase
MPSIKLYGPRMGSSFRPHWMLAELGLEYETVTLDMAKGEHMQPDYLAVNPAGQVPAMVHDGLVLTESAAIVHYLGEKYAGPKMFGPMTPESHAQLLRWQFFTLLNLDKAFGALAGKKWGRALTEEQEAKVMADLARMLPVFEGWIKDKQYLLGDDFSTADVVCRSTFMYAELIGFDLSAYPGTLAWMARCAERPAFQKAKQG